MKRLIYFKVVGANGFLDAHVIDQLVKKGYRARGYAIAQSILL
jgi:hypothetical protein